MHNFHVDGGFWAAALLTLLGLLAYASLKRSGLIASAGSKGSGGNENAPTPSAKKTEKKNDSHGGHSGGSASRFAFLRKLLVIRKIIIPVVILVFAAWVILGGWRVLANLGSRTLTGTLDYASSAIFSTPDSPATRTRVVYRTVIPKFEPMKQAETCALIPMRTVQVPAGDEWTPSIVVPPGCATMVDVPFSSGLYRMQCTNHDGQWSETDCAEVLDFKLQKTASDDLTPLLVKVWFAPLKPVS